MIPNRFNNSPVAFHAINRCFIRAANKAYPHLKKHVSAHPETFRFMGDLLVQEEQFVLNSAEYTFFCESATDPCNNAGPYIFIIAAETFSWHHVDERLEAYLGYDIHELETDWVIAYHPESCEETDEEMTNIMRSLYTGESNYAEMDIRYQTKPGYSVWAHQTMSLVRDWNGNPEYFLTVVRDTSMQKWAQLFYNELRILQELMYACNFEHETARWIDGLIKHYNGEQVDGQVLNQIQAIMQDLV